ncbi:LAETG motif-containing sortase-dependent surface protein [Streptomyces sp. NPDC048191]|uniref:LAETG motif-containing sortase-dependent surface protein n=1 Tax=Streptomyces sp. NPDC048191 TaxID=3155484 RepID=UPI00340A9B0E
MSSARRPLLTATAAGTLLCALWFVPSANASQDSSTRAGTESATTHLTQQARAVSAAAAEDDTELADTGGPDTTPYVVGGTLFLGVGAGFVVYSVRRERMGF